MKNTVKWLEGMLYPLDKALEKEPLLKKVEEVTNLEWEAVDEKIDSAFCDERLIV